ncbi:hypothetical protein C7M84_009245 [Penaeus vannamei]|uniref:Mutator-like transposase domain-containing protein n=1 Tax=Penaeus vannamei TaxID=6689 RepID=A0A423T7E9_PENVA|nr:hypothetical protein C7M84_009245 [Penaeus vannamei]
MEGHYTELMPIIHQTVTRYYCEELGVLPVDNIIPIEVSYDGTYAKRGFRSLHAMGYLVEVYTGYIIDMLVIGKCSVCPREARGMQVCPHGNYIGSSGGMEVQIAKILWGRSRDLGFEYKVMVADGDASTYNAIKDTYGRSSVVKEMCANHVAHVFSPHHHDFCPPGEGSWCKYQKALARGEDSSRAIQEPGIFSTFPLDARKEVEKIYSDLSDVTLLEKCQKGHTQNANESLHSKLWSKVAKHEYHGRDRFPRLVCDNLGSQFGKRGGLVAPFSGAIQEPGIFPTFPLDARKEVEKIYSDLSDVTLLEKCQKGYTQNANESLHSKLWSKFAKREYHGHERIVSLARVTTLDHNLGSEEGSWLRSLGVGTSDECLRPLPLPCPYSGPRPPPWPSPGSPQYRTVSASPVRHGNTALGRGGPPPCLSPRPRPFPCPFPGPRLIPHSFGESCLPWYHFFESRPARYLFIESRPLKYPRSKSRPTRYRLLRSRPPLYIGSRPRCFLPESRPPRYHLPGSRPPFFVPRSSPPRRYSGSASRPSRYARSGSRPPRRYSRSASRPPACLCPMPRTTAFSSSHDVSE